MNNDKETTVSLLQSSADEITPSDNSTTVVASADNSAVEANVDEENTNRDLQSSHLPESEQPDKESADEMKNASLHNQSKVANESQIAISNNNNSPRVVQRYTGCLTSVPKKIRHGERSNSAGKLYHSNRRVSFPENDSELVTGYLEPANPWASGKREKEIFLRCFDFIFFFFCVLLSVKPVACVSELAELYRESCEKHNAKPIDAIIKHLETLDLSTQTRRPVLNLREQNLTAESCEALEEVLKRVSFLQFYFRFKIGLNE